MSMAAGAKAQNVQAELSSFLKRKSSSQERQNSAEGSGLCCRMAALTAGAE
jgi:hypothetical protein